MGYCHDFRGGVEENGGLAIGSRAIENGLNEGAADPGTARFGANPQALQLAG